MILAVFFIIVGVILLLRNLGLIVLPNAVWPLLYPIILILLGVYFAVAARKGKYYGNWLFRKSWRQKDNDREQ